MPDKLVIRVKVKGHWPFRKEREEVRVVPLAAGHVLYRVRVREESSRLFVDTWTAQVGSEHFDYDDYDSARAVEVNDVLLADLESVSVEPA